MTVLLAHPTGSTFVRAAAQAFHASGRLQGFHTTLGWCDHAWLPPALQRRGYPLPPRLLHRHAPGLELARLLAVRAGLRSLTRHESGPLSVDRIYHQLDRAVARSLDRSARRRCLPQALMAYEDGALASFQAAARHGVARVYELPIGHWRLGRSIFAEEAQRRPAWAPTLEGLSDSPAKLARKDEELASANLVLVPSAFVKDSLQAAAFSAPVAVVPYGCPPPLKAPPPRPASGPLRVLFVGGLSQRKGLADLLEAAALLGDTIQLTLIGRAPAAACQPLELALARHRWLPSLTNPEVQAQMRCHDVLVLPSLFEGLPLVISEALSQGLPVIATPNAAAEERISHGVEGFVVPIRNPEAIAVHLEWLAADRDRLEAMARAALQRAAAGSWHHYSHMLLQAIAPFSPL
jgi:glycosyltransferase involved in cell wall biosynthesis